MDIYNEVIWIVFFAAAFLVYVSRRANWPIVLALLGFGLPSLLNQLLRWGTLSYETINAQMQALRFVDISSTLLLVIGIFILTRNKGLQARGEAAMQDARGVDLATLFTPRNTTNSYTRGETLRDTACEKLVARAKAGGLEIVEQRSQAHSPTIWLRLDYRLPSSTPEISLPVSVAVDIERLDFHRFEHIYTVTLQIGSKIHTIHGVTALDDHAVERIHESIVVPGKKLRLGKRLRFWPWQLWRPANKVQRIRRDWMVIGATILAVVLSLIPLVGILLTIGIAIWLYLEARKRRTYVLTTGQPPFDPRSLRWMDSWQVSIFGLGSFASTVQQGVTARMQSEGPAGATVTIERIGYWGTDSWVEREQIVIRHRRAIGFVHVVQYGEVLYVAWESHLNSAAWVEQRLAEGIDRESGLPVVANRVVAGSHRLNEYDVSDSNFLAEWIHEATKREIKLRMAEHKIDQEINFTVQRESRTDALRANASSRAAEEKSQSRLFKRVS